MTSLRHSLNLKDGGVISLAGGGGKTSLMFRLARELSGRGDPVLSTTTTKIHVPSLKQSPVVVISGSADGLVKTARSILRRNRHISAGRRLIHFQNKLKGFAPETIDTIWRSGVFRWIVVEADGAAGRPLKAPAPYEPVFPECTKWVIGVVGLEAVGKPLTERWAFRSQLVSKITGLAPGEVIKESDVVDIFLSREGILKNCPDKAMRFAFLNKADSQQRIASGRRIAKMIRSRRPDGFMGVLIGQTLYEPPVKEYFSKG